jgi:hypothetical protein
MIRNVKKRWFLISLCMAPLLASVPSAAQQAGNRATTGPDAASLSQRVDRLEAQLKEVENQMAELQREKQAVQQDLDHQKQEAAATAQPMTASYRYRGPQARGNSDLPSSFSPPGTLWGARVGYQDFPFRQQQGGFYYGFFVDHRLFSEEEGIPGGDLSTEITVGIGRSGVDRIGDESTVLLEKAQINYRQTMLSGWIGMKYHLNYWAPYGFRPYVVAGPGIWGDVAESPPLFIGQSLPSTALSSRNLPVVASADLFEGGQGGAGFEFSLARTRLPIIERANIGFDYRYSAWTTGERFGTYSFSLSAGE